MNGNTHTKATSSQGGDSEQKSEDFWFPGRWVGGITMILGPILLLVGALLRIQFHFFFPQQLAAFAEHPILIVSSYSAFLAGNILLCPAIDTFAILIFVTGPDFRLCAF